MTHTDSHQEAHTFRTCTPRMVMTPLQLLHCTAIMHGNRSRATQPCSFRAHSTLAPPCTNLPGEMGGAGWDQGRRG